MSHSMQKRDKFWLYIIGIISLAICGAVAFLILGPRPDNLNKIDVSSLPLVNATLNSMTFILLVAGLIAILKKKVELHKNIMLGSFFTSTVFLMSYVIYHWFKIAPKKYTGEWTTFYYTILISHIILAAIIVPLALVTFYWGWRDDRPRHKKIARVTFPIWIYVSITGVLIYVMLY